MFRQSKRRVANRRNFGDQVSRTPGKFILNGITSEEEKQLYQSLYESKLSFYEVPPKGEITLEQFELWAIDRLKVLLEIESCVQRNKTAKEIEIIVKPLLQKLLPFTTEDLQDRKKTIILILFCGCASADQKSYERSSLGRKPCS